MKDFNLPWRLMSLKLELIKPIVKFYLLLFPPLSILITKTLAQPSHRDFASNPISGRFAKGAIRKSILLFFCFALLLSKSALAQGKLWGMTPNGGNNGAGVLFQYDLSSSTYLKAVDFSSGVGTSPYGSLMLATNGKLYGMTTYGGANGIGVLFEYDPSTSTYTKEMDFSSSVSGANPWGSLVQASDGKLYGMTINGGVYNSGVLFEYDLSTYTYTKKLDFSSSITGSNPYGNLIQASNGKLYGMTYTGGVNNAGVLFEYDPTASTYTKKLDFSSSVTGANPLGSLVQASNGKLYGMTYGGGATGFGTLFQYDLSTSAFTKKVDFNNTNGGNTFGTLIQASNGKLYGMTPTGGTNGQGVLFEYDPSIDTYLKRFDFASSTSGAYPYGSLVQASNGKLYGFTNQGGANNVGVLFEYDPSSSAYVKKTDFSSTNGANPYISSLVFIPESGIHIRLSKGGVNLSSTNTIAFPPAATVPSSLSFTISNTGGQDLVLNGAPAVQVSGTNASDFTVTQPGLTTISPGQTTNFSVSYLPQSAGQGTAQLNIVSNDPDITSYILNLTGPGSTFYGPQNPPIGTSQFDSNGEAGRAGGRNIIVSAISLSTKTSTYWGPQINSTGELQLKVSLDGSTYAGQEILSYDPTSSDLANGKAVWKGQTFIQNAINGTTPPVYIRATLLTKKADNSIIPLVDPVSLGLSEQVGGLVKFNGLSDVLNANYFIEASLSPSSGFQPYLDFYDAYPTPPGPLPGQGIGSAYSSINNGFYWLNLSPKLTANAVFNLNEGEEKVITTSTLNATDDEDMPGNPQKLLFEFQTDVPPGSPPVMHGKMKLNNVVLTKGDVFTLKDIQDGKVKYAHDGGETIYDEFQFSLKDGKGTLAVDGPYSVYSFRISVTPLNDPPIAQNLNFQSSYAAAFVGHLKATDVDNSSLTYEIVTVQAFAHVLLADSTFTFTVDPGYLGSFVVTYRAFDGTDYSAPATVTIVVQDLAPIVANQNITTQESTFTEASFAATDPENEAITFSIEVPPTKGQVQLLAAGNFRYTPNADVFGSDQFTYKATDTNNGFSTGVVTITIKPNLDAGDLLIGDRDQIVLVDPVNNQDAVAFSGSNLHDILNVMNQKGSSVYVLDKTSGLIKIDPADGSQTILLDASNFNSNPGPLGIIENSDGELVVTDGSNGIKKINSNTGASTSLSSGGSLILPAGIAQLSDGSYVISDAGAFAGQSSKIIKVSSGGIQTVISSGGSLMIPLDLELVNDSTVFVADAGSFAGGTDAVIKVNLKTGEQTIVSSGDQFSSLVGIALNKVNSSLFGISQSNKKLLAINQTNGQQTPLSVLSPLDGPFGLAVITSPGDSRPTIAASNLTFSNIINNAMDIALTPGNGEKRVILMTALGKNSGAVVAGVNIEDGVELSGNSNFALAPVYQSGWRVMSAGNNSSLHVTGLRGDYYYRVAVIEYNGSDTETLYLNIKLFGTTPVTLPDFLAPTLAASNITITNVLSASMQVNFTPGNGEQRLAVLKAGSAPAFQPADDAFYSGELGNAETAVYNGNGNSFQLTGLLPNTTYYLTVFEFNTDSITTKYLRNSAPLRSQKTLMLPNVYVTSPGDGAINLNTTLNITALSFTGATTYTIELSTDPAFTNAIVHSGGRTLSFNLDYGTLYFTRVKTNLREDYGKVTTFTTRTAESLAYVTSPADNAMNISNTSLNISSNTVPGASTYTIQLSELADFSTVAFEVTGATRTLTFTGLGLKYNTTYYNRVRTNLSPVFGQVRSFTTRSAPLPYVTSPGNNAVNINNTALNISANTISGASSYTIQLSEAADFSTIAFEVIGTTRILAFVGLKYNTLYYNRVRTNLSPTFGQVRSFTTRTAESLAYVTNPGNGATKVSVNPTIAANTVPGATTYTIQLSRQSNFSSIDFEKTSATQTSTFTGLISGTLYYNRVRTNLTSQFGQVRVFTTTGVAPSSARIASNPSTQEIQTKELQDFEVRVYPNPFKEKLTVYVESGIHTKAEISLADMNGRIVHQSNEKTNSNFDINDALVSGVYMLQVRAGKEVRLIRVVKIE